MTFSRLFAPCLISVLPVLTVPLQAAEWTVTSVADSGPGTLRAMVAAASSGDTIVFKESLSWQDIVLTSGQILLDKNLFIDATSLTGVLTISGNADADAVHEAGESRIFETTSHSVTKLRSLRLENGHPPASGEASSSRGGAIYNRGHLTLELCEIRDCRALSGGGVFNMGTMILKNSTLRDNGVTSRGGAVYNAGTLEISRCLLDDNSAAYGGGIYNLGNASVTLSTLSANSVSYYGGALMNTSGAEADVSHSTLSGNSAQGGGGGVHHAGIMEVSQCTVAGNSAPIGGGFYVSSESVLNLIQSTVSENTSGTAGGGLFNQGSATLFRCIVAGNFSSNDISHGFTDGGHNLVSGAVSLRTLGDYGGTTRTMPPMLGSAAINAGGGAPSTFMIDQRGRQRVVGSAVDIGAVEYDPEIDGDSGFLGFASEVFSAPEGAFAAIRIVRTGGSLGRASVRVDSSTIHGTATPQDFGAIVNYTCQFDHGQTEAFVYIGIYADPELKEPNETFTLTMSNPAGAQMAGGPASCTVRIIDAVDKARPSLKLSHPQNNFVTDLTRGHEVDFIGIASDNQGIERVEISLNQGPWKPAILNHSVDFKSCGFTHTVPLEPGSNLVQVRAVDTMGLHSSVRKVTCRLDIVEPLHVSLSGPPEAGEVTPSFHPVSDRMIGQSYTLTAKARPGYVFDGWTRKDSNLEDQWFGGQHQARITFVMLNDLHLTAHFRTNPFGTGVNGSFSGLVLPHGTPAAVENLGLISVNVTSKGAFTGSLLLAGEKLGFKGVFNNQGDALMSLDAFEGLSIKRGGGKVSLALSMKLNLDAHPVGITGRISEMDEVFSSFTAERALYSRGAPVPVSMAGTKGQRYNLILPAKTQTPAMEASLHPQGTGIGSMTLKPDGKAGFTFVLADGAKFTAAAALSNNNECPVFAQLYRKLGLFSASFALDLDQADTDGSALDARWFRPFDVKAPWYPYGWPEGLRLDVHGSRYNGSPASAEESIFPGLTQTNPGQGNASLSFSGGLLDEPMHKVLRVDPAGKVSPLPTVDTTFKTKLKKSTGEWLGAFTHSDGKKPVWRAMTFQKAGSTFQGAQGFFLSTPTRPANGFAESGRIVIEAD